MRDPNRIPKSLARLESIWKTPSFSDMRLGQLMSNLLGIYYQETNGRDPFFPEDEEFLSVLEKYFNKE